MSSESSSSGRVVVLERRRTPRGEGRDCGDALRRGAGLAARADGRGRAGVVSRGISGALRVSARAGGGVRAAGRRGAGGGRGGRARGDGARRGAARGRRDTRHRTSQPRGSGARGGPRALAQAPRGGGLARRAASAARRPVSGDRPADRARRHRGDGRGDRVVLGARAGVRAVRGVPAPLLRDGRRPCQAGRRAGGLGRAAGARGAARSTPGAAARATHGDAARGRGPGRAQRDPLVRGARRARGEHRRAR